MCIILHYTRVYNIYTHYINMRLYKCMYNDIHIPTSIQGVSGFLVRTLRTISVRRQESKVYFAFRKLGSLKNMLTTAISFDFYLNDTKLGNEFFRTIFRPSKRMC